jgi:hypothetical protein
MIGRFWDFIGEMCTEMKVTLKDSSEQQYD